MIRAICDKCGGPAQHKLTFKKYPVNTMPLFVLATTIPDASIDICTACYLKLIEKTADYSKVKA